MIKNKLERILKKVQKPARYVGGEHNQVVKSTDNVTIRFALCFPDTYEIGMSNLGMRIIYGVLNNIENVYCQRVFAPWHDMEELMRAENIPLYALESHEPINEFDIIGFSIGYELSYTNVLNMLDLAGVPIRSHERDDSHPIVIAGGTCCFNPEPMSQFFDLMVIGDGEEVIIKLINLFDETNDKSSFLIASSKIAGVYVPSIHDSGKCKISKNVIRDLDSAYFPVNPIVPSTEIVHDRVVLELFRGCKRGCKFCQAGHVNRPVRERKQETLFQHAMSSVINTGYDEIALLSLSTSDYEQLSKLCDNLLYWCEPRKISLSMPSMRVDKFNYKLLCQIQKVRKSGLTFAPEAGSQRLRDYINKNISHKDILDACKLAFAGGWNSVKLYFILGLPTETDDDVVEIANLASDVLEVWRENTNNRSRGARITVSTSYFIPKPHTPFEREPQIPISEYLRRVELLKSSLKSKMIKYNYHSAEPGYIEAALSRGDKKIGDVIENAWRLGAKFDAWSEHFSMQKWEEAFDKCSLSIDDYASRTREQDEILPWGFIDVSGRIVEDNEEN